VLLLPAILGRCPLGATALPAPALIEWGHAWYRYQKLGQLLAFVGASAADGCPASMLSSIEGFVGDEHQRWLKIAGGPKAEVLDATVQTLTLSPSSIAVEMGCFVGYTAIRLGWRFGCRAKAAVTPESWRRPSSVSAEFDAIHVCIARHHIDMARLSEHAEVWPGHVPWITPRFVELFGELGVGFVFMDHKGTRFHLDLADCRSLRAFAAGAHLLCDNVLKPGAPEYLWAHHRSSRTRSPSVPSGCPAALPLGSAVVWMLHEFMEPEAEDWMSLLDCTGDASR